MGNTLMEISVPLDKENFIELECDFCKNRFMLQREREKELYTPSDDYTKCAKKCCNIDIKVTNMDKETGTYCPVCGRME